MRSTVALLSTLLPLSSAINPPAYSGYTLTWQSIFPYAKGVAPDNDNDKWNVITGNLGVNNEVETYTRAAANVECSGNDTLLITPVKASNGAWTSGRIESRYTFTPTLGKTTLAEARIRFGSNAASRKQGIWPAFWLLGDSNRHGTTWPACGELDVFEAIDGQLIGHGTAHCGTASGGPCNETTGLTAQTTFPDNAWHTWRIKWDRTPPRTSSSWLTESITWYLDGKQFHQVKGSTVNSANAWVALAHSPLYFILNVAVGGIWVSFVGPPLVLLRAISR